MSERDGQSPPEGGQAESQQDNAPGPGPWASALERYDESVRGDVDAYLREKWQPRVTKIEQRARELEESQLPEGMQQFYLDLQEDPLTTAQRFITQLNGEDTEAIWETALRYAQGDPDADSEPEYDEP